MHSAWSDPSLDTQAATRFNTFSSDHCHVGDISCLCNAKCLAFCMVGLITRHCHALQIAMYSIAGCIARHCHTLARRRGSEPQTPKCVRHVLVTSRSPVTVMRSVCVLHGWTHHSALSHPVTSQISLTRTYLIAGFTARHCHTSARRLLAASVKSLSPPVESASMSCQVCCILRRRLLQHWHQRWKVIP